MFDHSLHAIIATDSLPLRSKGVTVGSSFSADSIFWQVNFASASLLSVYIVLCISATAYKFTIKFCPMQTNSTSKFVGSGAHILSH